MIYYINESTNYIKFKNNKINIKSGSIDDCKNDLQTVKSNYNKIINKIELSKDIKIDKNPSSITYFKPTTERSRFSFVFELELKRVVISISLENGFIVRVYVRIKYDD